MMSGIKILEVIFLHTSVFWVFLSHACLLSIHIIGGMNDYFVVLISFEYIETFVECDSLHMEANIFWNSLTEKERQSGF